jgi:hypothetical protein
MNEVRKRVNVLKKVIEKTSKEISIIQETCQHQNKDKEHHSNSGYATKTEYWTNFHCLDCGKFWTEEGSK